MTTAVQQSPVIHFLQETVLRPYVEGAERVNRAIEGVNLHHIYHSEIDLLTRAWTLLVGIALMIPLINAIIWKFTQTCGNAEKLAEPFIWTSPAAAPPMIEEEEDLGISGAFEIRSDAERPEPLSVRELKYLDVEDGKPLNAQWSFETHEDMHYIIRDDGVTRSETSFDLNWLQKTHSLKGPETDIYIKREADFLIVSGTHKNERKAKELKIPNSNYPWIQQPTTGFRPFILSKQREMRFYGIHPIEFKIRECIAKKEEDHLGKYGKVTKVTFKFNDGVEGCFGVTLGNCWFHPKTGDLLEMEYRLGMFAWGKSELAKN